MGTATLAALAVVAAIWCVGAGVVTLARVSCRTRSGLASTAFWMGCVVVGAVLLGLRALDCGWDLGALWTMGGASALMLVARRRWASRTVEPEPGSRVSAILAGIAVAVAGAVIAAAWSMPENAHDAHAMWLYRARLFSESAGFVDPPEHRLDYPHPEYPPLFPLLVQLVFRAGGLDLWSPHVLTVAAWLSLIGLLVESGEGRPRAWIVALAVGCAGPVLAPAARAVADVSLAALVCGAVLWMGRGIQSRRSFDPAFVIGAAFVCGATSLKNEASVLAIVLCVVAAISARRIEPGIWVAAGALLGRMPWQWITSNHGWTNVDFRLGARVFLQPAILLDRLYEIPALAWAILMNDLSGLPLVIGWIWVLVYRPSPRRLSGLAAWVSLGGGSSVLCAYLASIHDMEYHVGTSYGRAIATPLALAGLALAAFGVGDGGSDAKPRPSSESGDQ